jgi:hypothetical protein
MPVPVVEPLLALAVVLVELLFSMPLLVEAAFIEALAAALVLVEPEVVGPEVLAVALVLVGPELVGPALLVSLASELSPSPSEPHASTPAAHSEAMRSIKERPSYRRIKVVSLFGEWPDTA